jgi:hypothetical protein
VVLFTSAIVVGALLLLGAALHALLAKSLYSQQSSEAVVQVRNLADQNQLGDVSGFDARQIQRRLQDRLTTGRGGPPTFKAVVLRGNDGIESHSDPNLRFEHVPASLAERVGKRNELSWAPRSPSPRARSASSRPTSSTR